MAARGYPRFTVDIDLLTTSLKVLERGPWAELEAAGATVEPCRGDDDDPLAGVVHILLADGTDIDIVVGKWKWEADVIQRAEIMTVAPGVQLRVPRTGDLIVLKLAAGGFVDLKDAVGLLQVGDRDALMREVESRLDAVRPDVRHVWREVLRETSGS